MMIWCDPILVKISDDDIRDLLLVITYEEIYGGSGRFEYESPLNRLVGKMYKPQVWNWYNVGTRIKMQWRRFWKMRARCKRKRLYDFTNDLSVTRTKAVIGEIPGNERVG